jgi:serine/threonine protein kinase/tetratricopeptide (TPR) repeat protein
MYLPQGTELNSRYVIETLLGHGGFGITYSAYDKVLNVRVAVKEYLPRQLATRAEGRTQVSIYSGEARKHFDYGLRKFLEEAQSVARFAHHPNVVSARDYFEANGTAYMVMEYIEGVTLKEYLEKKGGRISFEEAKGIMMPVMDALREVHQGGLLHRDISPDNIYITSSAQVKILDFGAARYFAGEQSKSLSVILKPGYAPEEQYRSSGKQGSWTDVYAVGATIYKALTGKTPPDALDRKEEDTLEPPSRLGVSIPPPAEQALLQALAVTASRRFQSMGEFQKALLGGEPMTMGFQTFQPTPESSYTPGASPGSPPVYTPPPASAQPSSHPSSHASHYPQLAQRSANPAAIAAGIGAGVIGLILAVGLIWWLATRDKVEPMTALKADKPPVVSTEVQAKDYFAAGIKQYERNNFPQALVALEKARDLKLKQPELFLYLGAAYDKSGQPEKAIVAWEEAIKLKPDFGEAFFNLAATYWHRGQKDLASKQFHLLQGKEPKLAEKLREKNPELARYADKSDQPPPPLIVATPSDVAKEELDKGRKYYQGKDYPNALKALAEAVKLNSKEAEAHYLLGLTYASLKKPQPKEAIEEFRQTVTLKPDTNSWSEIGAELARLDHHKLAAEALKEAVNANPGDNALHYQLGEAYVKADEINKAKEEQMVLKDRDPELAKKLLASINSHRRSGRGRSMGQQIDDLATKIRIQRGEIPSTGARAPKPSAPPRTQQPPPKPAQPTPPAGVGWRIEKRGEVQR